MNLLHYRVTKQIKWNRARCGQQHGRMVGARNPEHLWLFGSLHIKCRLNASWPYSEMPDNDAVRVKSPKVCKAIRLQGDRIASRLSTISRRPTYPLTDCCMPHRPPLSSQLSRWHAQPIVQRSAGPSVIKQLRRCRTTEVIGQIQHANIKYIAVVLYVTWSTGAIFTIAY